MFRPEAIEAQRERLSGEVSLALPVSWKVIGYLLFLSVAAALIFLSLAPYSRVETVTGLIVPDKGVAVIQASRPGTILNVAVNDGDTVATDETLAVIRVEEQGIDDQSAGARVEAALAQQDSSLNSRASAMRLAVTAQQGQLRAQIVGLREEIASLQSQVTFQGELVKSSKDDLERVRPIAEKGFISISDLRDRKENLISRQQSLAQLRQTLSSRQATLAEVQKSANEISAQAQAQSAEIDASRAQLDQQIATISGQRSYALRAPVAGRVTAVTARRGQTARPDTQLMTIIPAGSKLRAELSVPSSAIGFVKQGQPVRLAIDAFPYQRFGVVGGIITNVSTSPISEIGSDGRVLPAYPIKVALDSDTVVAFGRGERLIPGMTLTARIITERQSLLQWLFEPLFAVQRR